VRKPKNKELEMQKAIAKVMAKNNLSYQEAMEKLMKQKNENKGIQG
jgi:hypothetical protein